MKKSYEKSVVVCKCLRDGKIEAGKKIEVERYREVDGEGEGEM